MRAFRLQSLQGLRQAQSRLSRRPGWVCPGCQRHGTTVTRRDSSTASTEKPWYGTTPIFYVNAAPHIGHLYTMVLTDVLKRWQVINGKVAYLCTGTDEHGMKIQRAAAKEGMAPKEFCDNNAQKFKELAQEANIANDFFIRTTDPEHRRAVEQFWLHLKNGLPEELGLYKGTHAGWYCVSDECFYPEDMVQFSVEPQTGRKMVTSIESGNEVEWIEEETWFFPLKKYKEKLLQFYDENPNWIEPQHRMNEVRNWVENHLEDLSVTRPVSRLTWGIPDPENKSNTIYVWVDALINYLTKAGYGSKWGADAQDKGIWPPDVQVVGKDIIRFHAIYWPALLMALELPLPKKLVCHGHWTMSNRKMSKSLGNVVNPFFAIQRWDIDPLRYFLMKNGSLKDDMSYSNESIMSIYQKDLAANIGNLFNRIARAKGNNTWTTERAVRCAREDGFKLITQLADTYPAEMGFMGMESILENVTSAYRKEMDAVQPSAAIREIYELLREANRLISTTEPWKLAKEDSEESRIMVKWVIYNTAEALRISGILLQPIMPEKCTKLLDDLGVKPERRTVEWAEKGKDLHYGLPAPTEKIPGKLARWSSLFPPVASVEVSDADVVAIDGSSDVNVAPKRRIRFLAEKLAKEAGK